MRVFLMFSEPPRLEHSNRGPPPSLLWRAEHPRIPRIVWRFEDVAESGEWLTARVVVQTDH